MESITKNRQSPAVLRAMAERAFGPAQLPSGEAGWFTELGHGWFNVVYRIDLLDGRRTILKIAPPAHVEVMSYERGAMATELAALRLIREHTSVPVPEILFGDQSHELCDADYFFMSHVEGEPLGLLYERGEVSPDDQIRFGEALGAVNRELNRIPGPWFGRSRGRASPPGVTASPASSRKCSATGSGGESTSRSGTTWSGPPSPSGQRPWRRSPSRASWSGTSSPTTPWCTRPDRWRHRP